MSLCKLILGGHEKLSIVARTVKRDLNALRMLLKTKLMYAYYTKMHLVGFYLIIYTTNQILILNTIDFYLISNFIIKID